MAGLVAGTLALTQMLADWLRAPLTAALTATLGVEAQIGGLALGWTDLRPSLTLEGVGLGGALDGGGHRLQIPHLHLVLDPLASLTSLSLQVKALVIEGLRLRLERLEDGRLLVGGLSGAGGETGLPAALRSFLNQGRMRLSGGEIEWIDHQTATPPLVLTAVNIDLEGEGAMRHLALQAGLAGDPQARLGLTLAGQVGAESPLAGFGTLRLSLESQALGSLLAGQLPGDVQLDGRLLRLTSDYRIEDFRLVAGETHLSLEGFAMRAALPGQGPQRLEGGRLELSLRGAGDQGQLQLAAEDLVLSLPGVFGNRPPLRLERLAGPLAWALAADGGLRLSSPGLEARNRDLELRLRFGLQIPSLEVAGLAGGEGAGVDGGGGNRGGAGAGAGRTTLASSVLDLEGEILNANAAAIRDYLPDPKLQPRGRAWLERAFPAGRVSQGVILIHGPLGDFPFRRDQGYFHILLSVEGMDLDFDPDWPPLRGLRGAVHFHGQGLTIATKGGEILGFPLLEAQAEIADLAEPRFLQVRGQGRGDFERGLAFLAATPLNQVVGPLPDMFIARGQAQVDLDLSLPLDKQDHPEDPLRLTGSLSWPGPASLTPAGTHLTLDDLEGVLGFGQEGVRASRLRARFLGQPLTLELDRVKEAEAIEPLTELRLGSTSPLKALAEAMPNPYWRHLEGEIPWNLGIRLPDPVPKRASHHDLAADFVLTSDLKGLAVKVPRPLGKAREEKRPLRLEWRVRAGTDTSMRGRYGDLALNLLLAREGKGELVLRRGALALGQERVESPSGDGLRLSGRLAELDLDPWWAWAKDLGAGGPPAAPALTVAGLRIDQLRLGQFRLRDLSVEMSSGVKAWEGRIQARELAGRLSLPFKSKAQPMRLEFDHLDLKPFLESEALELAAKPSDGKTHPPRDPSAGADPRQARALDLVVARLHWSDNDLGRFILRTHPEEGGLEISELRLSSPGQIELDGRGSWSLAAPLTGGAEEARSRTRLDLAAKAGDLGKLLSHLGYASPLEEAPARAQAQLSWPGGPGDLALVRLEGEIDLEIGKGSLLEVDPGVGRVLGVLNLGALGRRLRLDFTDFFERGFVFTGMRGRLGLEAGRAELIEPLVIQGSSAEVRIEGRADLISKTLDQVATVTPSLGGGVALASALTAGPLVGAAVLIADKASGGALDAIGRHAYTIRGPWEEPLISPRSGQAAKEEARVPSGATDEVPGKRVGALAGKWAADGPGKASGDRPAMASADALGSAAPRSREVVPSRGIRPASDGNAFLDQP